MGWFILGLILYFFVLLAEKALVAVSPHDLEMLRTSQRNIARRAYTLAREVRPALAALLVARIFLKISIVVFFSAWLLRQAWLHRLLWDWSQQSGLPPFLVWFVVLALVALALAGIFRGLHGALPRQIKPGRIIQQMVPFILFWKKLFAWLIKKEKTPELESTPAQQHKKEENNAASAGEKRDIELLKSIVKFSDVTVKQVMQPRSKVIAVDFRTNFEELLAVVREAGFSRLPVYDEDLDNLTGILYVKDLVPHLDKPADFEWQSLIRTNVLLVPESKRGSELLKEFKKQKLHMAVVVDEYGGSSGIVTLEDVLEEITGDIQDEFDEASEMRYRKIDENNYIFEGQILLNEMCRIAGIATDTFDEIRGTSDTLAGLVLELKGDIPQTGAELSWNGYYFTVVDANRRRVEQVKFSTPS